MFYDENVIMTKRLKRIKQGVTFWRVHAFPGNLVEGPTAYITKCIALGKVFKHNHSFWIPTFSTPYYPCGDYKTPSRKNFCNSFNELFLRSESCKDMHLTPQSYNHHRVFFSKRAAEKYVQLVLSGSNISQMFNVDRQDYTSYIGNYYDED